MESNWWGLDKLTRLSQRYSNLRDLQKFLGDVLEGERQILTPIEGEAHIQRGEPFVVRDDVEAVLERFHEPGWLARMRGAKRGELVFEALAPFFEAGFVLERRTNENELLMRGMFLMGRTYFAKPGEEVRVDIQLPPIGIRGGPQGVVRGRVRTVLGAFGLESLMTLREASAFAFAPERDLIYVVICNRPHPWQVGVLEKTYNLLQMIFGSRSSAKDRFSE